MADSSARKLNEETQRRPIPKETTIVLNPKSVPWSRFEKVLVTIGTIVTLGLMVFLVSTSVNATSSQHRLANIQEVQTNKQNENADLLQKIGELTSSSRMAKVAQKQGLTLIESNIRNIR